MPTALPYVFPLFFLAMWLGIGALLAEISGWPALARRFPASSRPAGKRLRRQIVSLGPTHESGVTRIVATPAGLYLDSHPLFRFRRPPLLIPWHAIQYRSDRRMLWMRWHELDLGGTTVIGVKAKGFQAISPFLPATFHEPTA